VRRLPTSPFKGFGKLDAHVFLEKKHLEEEKDGES
jgi:hypothetical protein